MGFGLKGPGEHYIKENIDEKLFTKNQLDKIPLARKEKLINDIKDYCGMTGKNYDSKKCNQLLDETYKYIPKAKLLFEDKREKFKKIELQNIRQKQYNGGLLSDLSYRNKEDFDIKKLENSLKIANKELERQLDIQKQNDEQVKILDEEFKNTSVFFDPRADFAPLYTPPMGLHHAVYVVKNITDTIYIVNTLTEKGFKLDSIVQRDIDNGFSAMYIENTNGDGFFVIRGTNKFIGNDGDGDDDIRFMIGKKFANQTYTTFKIFDEIVPKGKKVSVYGHSLGGYLAQALTLKKYPQIEETITYDAPGLPTETKKARIIKTLFEINESYHNIQNIISNYGFVKDKGQRIGNDNTLTQANSHPIATITNKIGNMTLGEMAEWSEKNQYTQYLEEKAKNCNIMTKFDTQRCKTSINQMKQTFKNNQKILNFLEQLENSIQDMERMSENLTQENIKQIANIDFQKLTKKYPKFLKLPNETKFRFIVDIFFASQEKETQNEDEILELISLYQLEKRGYKLNQINLQHTPIGIQINDRNIGK